MATQDNNPGNRLSDILVLIGLLIMGAITAGNIHAIRSKINALWLHEK